MKKFFILCLMAFVMCSCNGNTKLKIKEEKIVRTQLRNDTIILGQTFIFSYDENGKYVGGSKASNDYSIEGVIATSLCEVLVEYDKNTLSSYTQVYQFNCSQTMPFVSEYNDKNEFRWFKKDGLWFEFENGIITLIDDKDTIAEWENYNEKDEQLFEMVTDDMLVIKTTKETRQITQYDEYGHWTKAIGKTISGEDDILTREITYYN